MAIERREFLKIAGITGLGLTLGKLPSAEASEKMNPNDPDFFGMLIDTTLCVGCRACEQACNEVNQLPKPEKDFSDLEVLDEKRTTTPEAFTVVNKFNNPKDPDKPIFVRQQCFHCNQPACASACLTRALQKTKEGPVQYHPDRCMGCRYCMIACPFDVPKFEYSKAAPFIKKCIFCFNRTKAGQLPACAEACPTGATKFGTRRELLDEARHRVYSNPDKYHGHIFGENEVGGTGIMYLASVPFEQLGFKTDLGSKPYPQHTQGFLAAVPLVFVLWPSFLAGLSTLVKGEEKKKEDDHE